MNKLIKFQYAHNWEERVFVDPNEVVSIQQIRKDRGMGCFSRLSMKNGTTLDIGAEPEDVAKEINRNRGWGNG
ncbi:MAG: hypothetical protein C0396_08290 [Anaerolinea sp.]|nr:hypothetical protein [Anaerolinea sp.]